MTLRFREVAGAIQAVGLRPDLPITGWSVDSRTIQKGDLFFALKGPSHDGLDHLDEVFEKGAVGAVVDRACKANGWLMGVPDVQRALEEAARFARGQWGGRIVGVTGSAGKTTTKDVIAALLSAELPTGKTIGNFNNQVGLPLSILRLPDDAQVAVLEFGMNHAGEISRLAELAQPLDTAVVTNVGFAHIESFGSIEGIAAAKRELIEALPAEGVAVLNADDPHVAAFRDVHPGRTITFGLNGAADVRAQSVRYNKTLVMFRAAGVEFESPLAGRHGVLNVLAGLAVAQVFGIAADRLRDAVRTLAPGKMRGERIERDGITIYNDCYNSNPDAARSMIDLLRDTPARRRIAVLGEMLELGQWSEPLHRDVGKYAAEAGITVLVGIRGAARHMVDEAVKAGLGAGAAYFFEDAPEAGEFLRGEVREGDAVLFKGSRGTRVERALEKFLE